MIITLCLGFAKEKMLIGINPKIITLRSFLKILGILSRKIGGLTLNSLSRAHTIVECCFRVGWDRQIITIKLNHL